MTVTILCNLPCISNTLGRRSWGSKNIFPIWDCVNKVEYISVHWRIKKIWKWFQHGYSFTFIFFSSILIFFSKFLPIRSRKHFSISCERQPIRMRSWRISIGFKARSIGCPYDRVNLDFWKYFRKILPYAIFDLWTKTCHLLNM